MKVFDEWEVKEAQDFAAKGKIALHLHGICFDNSPRCFRDAVFKRKECIGHLVDLDKERLVRNARGLGVKVVYIDHEDQPFQHVDLCGGPLRKLIVSHADRLVVKGKIRSVLRVKAILKKFPGSTRWV